MLYTTKHVLIKVVIFKYIRCRCVANLPNFEKHPVRILLWYLCCTSVCGNVMTLKFHLLRIYGIVWHQKFIYSASTPNFEKPPLQILMWSRFFVSRVTRLRIFDSIYLHYLSHYDNLIIPASFITLNVERVAMRDRDGLKKHDQFKN
jgi:hypothetical protein